MRREKINVIERLISSVVVVVVVYVEFCYNLVWYIKIDISHGSSGKHLVTHWMVEYL